METTITEILVNSFGVYKDLFGGNPRNSLDVTYTEFNVEIRKSSYTKGEADPKIIILNWSEDITFGFTNWKVALLHELFHLWNGESFRYKDGSEHWFNEGFSEFYAWQTAAKLGMISSEEILSTSVFPIGYYNSSSGLGEISMREAGIDYKTKFENYFLIYHGGWVSAMLLDIDIRNKTNNKKSLDDLMKWLYDNFLRTKKLYDGNDIVNGIKITTDQDYCIFFEKHINGLETIPVSNYFDLGKALIDYKWNEEGKEKHKYLYKSLGIEN
jgi:predicted metalloprotease with PDZ domain